MEVQRVTMTELAQIFLCLSVISLGVSVVGTVLYVRYAFRVLTEMVGSTIQVSLRENPEVMNEVNNEVNNEGKRV